jgi:hypothetical protein
LKALARKKRESAPSFVRPEGMRYPSLVEFRPVQWQHEVEPKERVIKTAPIIEQPPVTHVLATASLHDGGGIFSLVWSLVVIPISLATIFNYRGMAEKVRWKGGGPMSPLAARFGALIFLAGGVLAIGFAIQRFMQGGY